MSVKAHLRSVWVTCFPGFAPGGQIVFASGGHDGAQVESIPVAPSGPVAASATPIAAVSYNIGVGAYKGGALVASQYDGSVDDWTYVDYAPAGKDFNASGSYHSVAKFQNEELVGISGDALLTEETTGNGALKLRLFNGTTFGPAHVVPASGGYGPAWFYFDQDPSGRSHVFSDRSDAPVSYDLYMQGKGSPIAKGRTIWLQVDRSGKWYTVATTHETSSELASGRRRPAARPGHSYHSRTGPADSLADARNAGSVRGVSEGFPGRGKVARPDCPAVRPENITV